MTTVAIMADPPIPGLVLRDLIGVVDLSADDVAKLYVAMFKDVMIAIEHSGGELLINYQSTENLPSEFNSDTDPADELASIATSVLDGEPRLEKQVGSNKYERYRNTITHLLDVESVQSAAFVPACTPLMTRVIIDSAAMKLRRHEVVVGPTVNGDLYYAGFTAVPDLSIPRDISPVEAVARHAVKAGFMVDVLKDGHIVSDAGSLAELLLRVRTLRAANHPVPTFTAQWFDEHDIDITFVDERPALTII